MRRTMTYVERRQLSMCVDDLSFCFEKILYPPRIARKGMISVIRLPRANTKNFLLVPLHPPPPPACHQVAPRVETHGSHILRIYTIVPTFKTNLEWLKKRNPILNFHLPPMHYSFHPFETMGPTDETHYGTPQQLIYGRKKCNISTILGP